MWGENRVKYRNNNNIYTIIGPKFTLYFHIFIFVTEH